MSGNWDFYLTRVHDALASIMVDLSLHANPPRTRYPNMAWVRVYMLKPREDGLSSQEEFDDLRVIDDAITDGTSFADAVYVGRKTRSGVRDYFFYAADGDQVRAAAAQALKAFPAYRHESGGQPDPEWGLYFELLYPSPVELRIMSNRDVLATLQQRGDDLVAPRQIDHWAYFPDETSRNRFREHVTAQGFTVSNSTQTEKDRPPFALVFGSVGAPEDIDEINIPLFEAAQTFGGEYDGWETMVMAPDKPQGATQ